MSSKRTNIKVRVHPAVLASWAAIQAAAAMLPSFPVFGSGGNFSVGFALAPLAGILFGPYYGALAVAIGEFIGSIIAPHSAPLGLFNFLMNTANSFFAGWMVRGKWWATSLYIAVASVVWYMFPVAREAAIFGIVYLLGIVMAPIGGFVGRKLFASNNAGLKAIGLWLCVFPCYITGSITGNILTLILFDLPADLWKMLTPIIPFERAVFSLGAAIIGVPLLIGLPKVGLYFGPEYEQEEEEMS